MNYKPHTTCRVCGSTDLEKYIDLGNLPLSNNLCSTPDEQPDRYPLQVMLCKGCWLSQLSIVVDPVLLFGHYVYRSSISEGYKKHCRQMSVDLRERYGLTDESWHLDIAGNDGALIKEFGMKSLNVDPAVNMAQICDAAGVRIFNRFWSNDAAAQLSQMGWPKFNVITATNVFAHVDDVKDFMQGVKTALSPTGVCILEFPYLIDFIEKGEFDTIYFEHLSYFSISPLVRLCDAVGLVVMRVEKQDIHGGTVRVHIGYSKPDETVKEFVLKEYKYRDTGLYYDFEMKATETIRGFRDTVTQAVGTVAGFAASAKGNTLLNCAGITTELKYIVDETPEKIGKYSPGTGIEIVRMDRLADDPPDNLVILSWNFADEIKAKCRAAGYKGEFIVPICG